MQYPFLFGTQYYRAPTPAQSCWENDMQNMKAMGFNAVKLWVQWRWSHRDEETFYFDDIHKLMDIAHQNALKVTLNVIFDVAPLWLYKKYPDAKPVLADGTIVEPVSVSCRQIGGAPGPCYHHIGAANARKKFLNAVVKEFAFHPALDMWDVWNEPEQCMLYRTPDIRKLSCYCPECTRNFVFWLQKKYGSVERLNEVWGRCYTDWEDVELPRNGFTFSDFIDHREFMLDTMTNEAKWRLRMVKEMDGRHLVYLHTVPNTMRLFNSLTCVDDFAVAQECDVFASTMVAGSRCAVQTKSAAKNKVFYNTECHIAAGNTSLHSKILHVNDLKREFLPQIGMGERGFMFWQYRPEVLGEESPAWGVVKPDGSPRPLSCAAKEFWDKISPYTKQMMSAAEPEPQIAVWNSRKNEIFSFCIYKSTDELADDVDGYIDGLYWSNYRHKLINGDMLENGELDGVKLLIMPACYCITQQEADSLDTYVRNGGTLLCEAHLGGYNATTGRHSYVTPGCGLADKWGIYEEDTTASYYLGVRDGDLNTAQLNDDVKKALEAYGANGGKYFPIMLRAGAVTAAERFAVLNGGPCEVLGTFHDQPCIIEKSIGKGSVIYCGSNLGSAYCQNPKAFLSFLTDICQKAGVLPTLHIKQPSCDIHVDATSNFIVLYHRSEAKTVVELETDGIYKGVFSNFVLNAGKCSYEIDGNFVDIFMKTT